MPSPLLPKAQNPYLRANSMAELLSWSDVDFVRCAFVTLLGRQPDVEGESHFTDRIRRGHSKLEVLWALRRSDEGSGHDPGISGFDRALKIAALRRTRSMGWIARLFYRGEGTSRADQNFRQILNLLAVIRDDQLRQSASLASVVDQMIGVASQVGKGSTPLADHFLANSGVVAPNGAAGKDADLSSRERLALSIIEKIRTN